MKVTFLGKKYKLREGSLAWWLVGLFPIAMGLLCTLGVLFFTCALGCL